jgi:hypothetical protein
MSFMDTLPVAVDPESSLSYQGHHCTLYRSAVALSLLVVMYPTLSRSFCAASNREECDDALPSRRNAIGEGIHAKAKLASFKTSEQGS